MSGELDIVGADEIAKCGLALMLVSWGGVVCFYKMGALVWGRKHQHHS
jgi:hypothetical protein